MAAASLSTTQLKLTWTAPAGAASYRIERATLGDASFVEIASGITTTTFTDNGLSPNTTYVYQIRAQNSAGLSSYSTVAIGTTKSGTVVAPGAPSGLTPSLNATNHVVLTWAASTGTLTDYHIERQGPSDASFVEIASGITTTSFTDTTASATVNYSYRVRAANGSIFSGYSGVVNATPGLYAPGVLGASAVSPTQINLNWTLPNEPMTGIHIERSDGSGFVDITTTTGTTYQDTTAVTGTAYTYRIRVENSGAFSPYSPTASATATAPQPSAFSSVDINMTPAGSTNVITDGKDYDVTAGGTGIYNTADGFRFVYEPLTGDFDVRVQIAGISAVGGGVYPQAGIAARGTLDAGSPTVALTASPTGGYRFKYRSTANGAVTQTQTGAATFPSVFIRMTRAGNVFTTYYSTDGATWTKYGTVTLALGATIDVGMAATSTTVAAQTTAQFRGFTNTHRCSSANAAHRAGEPATDDRHAYFDRHELDGFHRHGHRISRRADESRFKLEPDFRARPDHCHLHRYRPDLRHDLSLSRLRGERRRLIGRQQPARRLDPHDGHGPSAPGHADGRRRSPPPASRSAHGPLRPAR